MEFWVERCLNLRLQNRDSAGYTVTKGSYLFRKPYKQSLPAAFDFVHDGIMNEPIMIETMLHILAQKEGKKMKEIYFDNSATTKLSSAAAQAMMKTAEELWGNPSSLHHIGLAAERVLQRSREVLLRALGIRETGSLAGRQLIFTGSGTEADNLAVFGCAYARQRKRGGRIIVSDSEHPAILEPCKALEQDGFEVIRLSTSGGRLDLDALERAITPETILLSIMSVNNETGAVYPVKQAFSMAKRLHPGIITHTDAVQAFGKIPLTVASTGADMITLSAHKLHGPKGVGALWVRPSLLTSKKIVPLLRGGGQEGGMRSGTENIAGIAGFAAAVEEIHLPDSFARTYLLSHLPEEVHPNLPLEGCAPHILNLRLPGIRSETMLHFLSSRGICVSAGSACSSHDGGPSHVLLAYGLTAQEASCSIRISLDCHEEQEDLDYFLAALAEGVQKLARIR